MICNSKMLAVALLASSGFGASDNSFNGAPIPDSPETGGGNKRRRSPKTPGRKPKRQRCQREVVHCCVLCDKPATDAGPLHPREQKIYFKCSQGHKLDLYHAMAMNYRFHKECFVNLCTTELGTCPNKDCNGNILEMTPEESAREACKEFKERRETHYKVNPEKYREQYRMSDEEFENWIRNGVQPDEFKYHQQPANKFTGWHYGGVQGWQKDMLRYQQAAFRADFRKGREEREEMQWSFNRLSAYTHHDGYELPTVDTTESDYGQAEVEADIATVKKELRGFWPKYEVMRKQEIKNMKMENRSTEEIKKRLKILNHEKRDEELQLHNRLDELRMQLGFLKKFVPQPEAEQEPVGYVYKI